MESYVKSCCAACKHPQCYGNERRNRAANEHQILNEIWERLSDNRNHIEAGVRTNCYEEFDCLQVGETLQRWARELRSKHHPYTARTNENIARVFAAEMHSPFGHIMYCVHTWHDRHENLSWPYVTMINTPLQTHNLNLALFVSKTGQNSKEVICAIIDSG